MSLLLIMPDIQPPTKYAAPASASFHHKLTCNIGTATVIPTDISNGQSPIFNPSTTIEFSVPRSGPVRVGVFDIHGKRVATLVNDTMGSGVYRVRWNGKNSTGADAASGVYYA